jgi:hypothetical protein
MKSYLTTLALSSLLLISTAFAREWTNQNGQKTQAAYVSCDGIHVILKRDGTKMKYAVSSLSDDDQQFLRTLSKWQVDWIEFGKVLKKILENPEATNADLARVFEGKEVQWTGTVTEITRESSKAGISMKMEPISFAPQGNSRIQPLLDLVLEPKDTKEWAQWAKVKAGTRVVFACKLKSPIAGQGAVSRFSGVGPNAGNDMLIVWTDGAMMVHHP